MKRVYYILMLVLVLFSAESYASIYDDASLVYVDEKANDFDFSLDVKSDQVEITWENFPEDVKDFAIQRSFDGKRFSNILQSNPTTQNFHQDDIFALPVEKMYYRFVFSLEDGEKIISDSKLISFSNKEHLEARIYVSGGQIDFSFNSSFSKSTTVQVFNNVGNMITEQEINTVKGQNSHSITLYGLRSGMYFLRLSQDTKSTTTKFFVR